MSGRDILKKSSEIPVQYDIIKMQQKLTFNPLTAAKNLFSLNSDMILINHIKKQSFFYDF
jgi:hypothetical protein